MDIRNPFSYNISSLQSVLDKLRPVSCGIMGIVKPDGDVEYAVPGGGAPGSEHTQVQDFEWIYEDARIVYASGHLHIGGRHIVFEDKQVQGENKEMMRAFPFVDEYNFVVETTSLWPKDVYLKKGSKYAVKATYENYRNYKAVMGLFQVHPPFDSTQLHIPRYRY